MKTTNTLSFEYLGFGDFFYFVDFIIGYNVVIDKNRWFKRNLLNFDRLQNEGWMMASTVVASQTG